MLRQKLLLSVLSLGVLFGAACNKVSDEAIATRVKAQMFSEPSLKTASLNVTCKDGIVTLTGEVPDDAARLAAQRIASHAEGVKTVVDQTTLTPPAPSTQLTAENYPPPAPAAPPQPSRSAAHTSKRETPRSIAHAPVAPAAPAAAPIVRQESAPAPAPATPVVPAPPPPQPVTVTVPASTVLTVRTIDTIDSATNTAGQSFRASLDAPIVADNRVVVPKGLNVTLKLVESTSAGKFKGRSELTVSLDRLTYQGRTYTLTTSDVQEKGASRGKRSAEVIGGGAALGAIIGAIAGGGKGAAIGAAVGGGGGTAVQAMTKGQQVKIPSETRLEFTLRDPVDITYLPPKKSSHSSAAPAQTPSPDQPASADQPPQQ